MDAIEIVERGLSKTTIDAAIQATETAEEKQKDEGICSWFTLIIRSLTTFTKYFSFEKSSALEKR